MILQNVYKIFELSFIINSFVSFLIVKSINTLEVVSGSQIKLLARPSLTTDLDVIPGYIPIIAEEDRSTCRKLIMVMGKRLMKILTGCIQEVKSNHPEKGGLDKYFQCAIKCGMRNVQMIDDSYKLSNETFNVFVTTHIPEKYHQVVSRLTEGCIKHHADKLAHDDDPMCLTFGDFVKCLQNFVGDQCVTSKGEKEVEI